MDYGIYLTTSFIVIVDNSGEPFKPERCTRQQDPISSYIFITCAKYLVNVSRSEIGIKLLENVLLIPYLMFTDDCIIFCKTNRTAALLRLFWIIIAKSQRNW